MRQGLAIVAVIVIEMPTPFSERSGHCKNQEFL